MQNAKQNIIVNKAFPNSRGKNAFAMLKRKETEGKSNNDPFKN